MARNSNDYWVSGLALRLILGVLVLILIGLWNVFRLYGVFGLILSILTPLLIFAVIILYYNRKKRKDKAEIQKIENEILRKHWEKK